MTLNIDAIARLDLRPAVQEMTARDTIVYALGLGYGEDPMDRCELPFVYEKGLHAMPSMANILCHPGFWAQDPQYGIDWVKVLHAEQEFRIHSPLPAEGRIRGEVRVTGVEDKGEGKGALIHQVKELFAEESGTHLASVRQTLMLRGNGGQGSFGQPEAQPEALPDASPDTTAEIATRPGLALLYRLSGDRNPLHADPAVAAKAGFDRPILHGLCTMGIAARALIQHCCDYDPTRLAGMFVRFSRPVVPGDTLRFELFGNGANLRFRARAVERDVVVLDRCHATIRP
ncbi:MAG: MaoC family dehydratase N-terminal domain-containing protein [Sphingomonadales bacterium]|nr:MaoC family dehydratase N-terminal domain-containing protein [Sphingomonadales bacterium]